MKHHNVLVEMANVGPAGGRPGNPQPGNPLALHQR